MNENYKSRVMNAMNRFEQKQLKKTSPKTKRNQKPEKITEKECLLWMRSKGWDVEIFEAKATYNPRTQRYTSSAMKAGTCDCIGVTNDGIPVFIEFKAKGKLSTFAKSTNYRQCAYLFGKIERGAFACVVDSAQYLEAIYIQWKQRKDVSTEASIDFLMNVLPRTKKQKDLSFD